MNCKDGDGFFQVRPLKGIVGLPKEQGTRIKRKTIGDLDETIDRVRAGEMAQWLRALHALPKVLSSIPGNHMVAHSHL